ncbi:cupin domain-containing protein [Lachnoclostridium sp. Marseille-P6806]|uniref:cupin domain-containing protein n=1 Tax=Lachnoclostridium sp. Marseille-P6806 TaxID=2364793 RepID=UPI001031E6F4|nr:cupin domain-containing protein [Lachnoclostridium sp. Marseille-P6806]
MNASQNARAEELIRHYHLERHPEGGWFAEVYSSSLSLRENGRPIAGSIYFLLQGGDISHFHQIDCDEPWYYHEGCGVRITVLAEDGSLREELLGPDFTQGQQMMVSIPKGAVFAAENLDPKGYTFMSCMTAPKFQYEGFRLVSADELAALLPGRAETLRRLCL